MNCKGCNAELKGVIALSHSSGMCAFCDIRKEVRELEKAVNRLYDYIHMSHHLPKSIPLPGLPNFGSTSDGIPCEWLNGVPV